MKNSITIENGIVSMKGKRNATNADFTLIFNEEDIEKVSQYKPKKKEAAHKFSELMRDLH